MFYTAGTLETEHLITQEEFKGALLLNTAACKLKQKEYTDTIRYATMALEEDPANIKGKGKVSAVVRERFRPLLSNQTFYSVFSRGA